MTVEKTEGIILHSLPFRDYDQLIKLYTKDRGLLSVVVKAARSKRKALASAVAPITRVEVVYKRGREDLHSCREISPLGYYLFLREDMKKLSTACEFAQAVKISQIAEKPSPGLYLLLKAFIERLETTRHPEALATALRLKILKHDGLLHFSSSCSACQAPLGDHYFYKGEPFCSLHCLPGGVRFTKEQFDILEPMIRSKRFEQLEACAPPDGLALSVKGLFEFIYL